MDIFKVGEIIGLVSMIFFVFPIQVYFLIKEFSRGKAEHESIEKDS